MQNLWGEEIRPQPMKRSSSTQQKFNEQLQALPCTPGVTSDHQIGAEATQVKVTVSETCSAAVYDTQALETQATVLLSTQAAKKLASGYRLIGDVHVKIEQATITHTTSPLVFLSFSSQGTWAYALNQSEQQHMKTLIAGKTKQAAWHMLQSLPGIESASIRWDENTKLPKNVNNIHFQIIILNSY
jgi:hypothetical protein